MANDKDVEKILQSLKKAYPDTKPAQPKPTGISGDRLGEIIAREAAAKAAQQAENTQPQTVAAVGVQEKPAGGTAEIENEFFSKLPSVP